ncbi:hypothetical protein WR25_27095 [Diploscapter pachys]|uniref:MADF domain-containing protein n=1 Tax=Diploscapter pachys TaxID=2018661 RepID=A0A2A2KXI9_9BILA|nr:hypothetical protein WR25_27095 [Diploscapter pachys]
MAGRGALRADETPMFNMRLIAEVKARNFLYNQSDEGYNLIAWRNAAWVEIAEALESTPDHVKTRWKTLRDRYKKEEKKERLTGKPSSWVFQKPLRFIQSHVKDKYPNDEEASIVKDEEKDEQVSPMEAAISFIEQEIIKTTAESTQEAKRASFPDVSSDLLLPVAGPKRPRMSLTEPGLLASSRPSPLSSNWQRIDDEEDEMFARMITLKLAKLEARNKEKAKMRILQILFEAQFGVNSDA